MSRRQARLVIHHFDSERVRARRLALGLTQEDLARATNVTLRAAQRWEHGASTPHLTQRLALARVLEVEPEDLYVEHIYVPEEPAA